MICRIVSEWTLTENCLQPFFPLQQFPAWMDEVIGQTLYSAVMLGEFFEYGKTLPIGD